MKKQLFVLIALCSLAVGSAKAADNFTWLDAMYGGSGEGNWNDIPNWFSENTGTLATNLPTAADTVRINGTVAGNIPPSMPIIESDVGSVEMILMAFHEAGDPSLTINDGGLIAVNTLFRMGHLLDIPSTLNMTGASWMFAGLGQIGHNEAHPATGGDGTINMSGSSVLHFGSLVFGQENDDYRGGDGVIHMSDNALLIVNGDLTVADTNGVIMADFWIANGRIDANGVADTVVQATYNATDSRTEFVVVSRPPVVIGDITQDLLAGTNALTLTWLSEVDRDYAVETKLDLMAPGWTTNMAGIFGTGENITVTTGVDQVQSFFRIVGE